MLKRIPKSDISVRPFKAYKEWSFDDTELDMYEANISSSELSNGFPKNSLYGQLRAQFYNGHEDNPFLRFGNKSNVYNDNLLSKERYLENNAKIISIPQIYVGEGIKKGSFRLTDNGSIIEDDLNGNLILLGNDTITFQSFNLNENYYTFDLQGTSYTVNITQINLESGNIIWLYNGDLYTTSIISFDINSDEMVVTNVEFASAENSNEKAGNIFYNSGLITLTRKPNQRLTSNWDLSFKSTETIYEHEYLLIVNEDEFNVSTNPSAVIEIGRETGYVTGSDGKIYKTTTYPGVKYIKKKSTLENGNTIDYSITSRYNNSISGGFEQYDYSSSLDSTGSYLAPFITTIGLYDDNCDLVAIAKLPQPIKSYPDLPVNFIVRFDT